MPVILTTGWIALAYLNRWPAFPFSFIKFHFRNRQFELFNHAVVIKKTNPILRAIVFIRNCSLQLWLKIFNKFFEMLFCFPPELCFVVPLGRLSLLIYLLKMRQYFFTEQIQYVWVVWKIFGEFVRVDNNPFFLLLILTIIQTYIRFVHNQTNIFSLLCQWFCNQIDSKQNDVKSFRSFLNSAFYKKTTETGKNRLRLFFKLNSWTIPLKDSDRRHQAKQ